MMLNPVELSERVRSLTSIRRLVYSLLIAVGIVAAFWLSIAIGVGLAGGLIIIIVGSPLKVPDDIIALTLPVLIVFMFTIGLSGVNGGRPAISGQNLRQAAIRAGRSGFLVGIIAGGLFGIGWGFLINANPPLFAAVMGVALALPLAFFRVVTCTIEPVTLYLLEGRRKLNGEQEHVR